MPKDFDPYFEWLGIPPKYQPPTHYRLLNLDVYEDDASLIATAAQRVTARLRDFDSGEHAAAARRLLKEVMAAGSCLLDDEAKTQYDKKIRNVDPATPSRKADEADELRLGPIEDSPQVRQVKRLSDRSSATPIAVAALAEPPVADIGLSAPFDTRSATAGRRHTRSRAKQSPAAIGAIGVLLLVVLGMALYFVVYAPPESENSKVAKSKKTRPNEPGRSTQPPKDRSTKRRGPRDRKSPVESQPALAAGELKLEPIDTVGAMPSAKPLPPALAALAAEPSPLGELAGDDDDDVITEPRTSKKAEAIWKRALAALERGELDVAIPALEEYGLHQDAGKHCDEAEQLLKEARVANSDKETVDAYLKQISDAGLEALIEQRATIDPGFKITNLVLNELFHKALRDRAPTELRRRKTENKKPADE